MNLENLLKNEKFASVFIEVVVDEVIRRIKNRPRKALVCFSGAAIGFVEAMESLVKLKEDGWELRIFLSDEAIKVFTPSYIKEKLGADIIYSSADKVPHSTLYGDIDQVIIATTTVNTAAKLANGICDNDMLTIINHALMAGIPTICTSNGADPDNETRASLGMGHSSPGYAKVLKNNLNTLKELGMVLCTCETLCETCKGFKGDTSKVDIKEASENVKSIGDGGSITLTKRVITRTDVVSNCRASRLKIAQEAILTELAKEAIAGLGIRVERI